MAEPFEIHTSPRKNKNIGSLASYLFAHATVYEINAKLIFITLIFHRIQEKSRNETVKNLICLQTCNHRTIKLHDRSLNVYVMLEGDISSNITSQGLLLPLGITYQNVS